MESQAVSCWCFIHLNLSIKTNSSARLKFQSEKAHQMSRWSTKLHFFFLKIRCLNGVRMLEWIQVREFLGIRSSSSLHPLRQVSTPEAIEEADGVVVVVVVGATQMFTHGVGPLNLPPQPQATYPRPSETLRRCILTTCLTITQSYDTHKALLNASVCSRSVFDWKRQDIERPSLTLSHPGRFLLTDMDKQ